MSGIDVYMYDWPHSSMDTLRYRNFMYFWLNFFKQGQALFEIRADVIHSKCINNTNFMSGIDTYTHH